MLKKQLFATDLSSVVYITPEALAKMEAYIKYAPGEISGLGEVEPYGDKDFLITDVFILGQSTTPGYTELNPDSLVEFLSEAVDQGRDLDKIHLWWHSHADIGVFWSSTDEETAGIFINAGWMISIVGNRAKRYLTRIDYYNPRMSADRRRLILLGQPVATTTEPEAVKAEVSEKVAFKVPVVASVTEGGSNDNQDPASSG